MSCRGLNGIRVGTFRYEYSGDTARRDPAEVVRGVLEHSGLREWLNCGSDDAELRCEALKTEALSMSLFDPLVESEMVLPTTKCVRQCPEVRLNGVECVDELRKYLHSFAHVPVDEDEVPSPPMDGGLSESARGELLFALFDMLAKGGSMSQPDLELQPYLDVTKALYRDLATVYRRAKDNEVAISTVAYECGGGFFFDEERPLQRCFVLVEPKKKTTVVVHSTARGLW